MWKIYLITEAKINLEEGTPKDTLLHISENDRRKDFEFEFRANDEKEEVMGRMTIPIIEFVDIFKDMGYKIEPPPKQEPSRGAAAG